MTADVKWQLTRRAQFGINRRRSWEWLQWAGRCDGALPPSALRVAASSLQPEGGGAGPPELSVLSAGERWPSRRSPESPVRRTHSLHASLMKVIREKGHIVPGCCGVIPLGPQKPVPALLTPHPGTSSGRKSGFHPGGKIKELKQGN